jgi:outer membrane protein
MKVTGHATRARFVAIVVACSLVHWAGQSTAQSIPLRRVEEVAAQYVADALQSNLALRGQTLEVERAELALQSARARFFPEVSLQSRYTRADGGRTIEFPLGTVLNPAYQTLNELLVAGGQAPRFAPLPNINFPFQRAEEQDTRVSLRQPIYQPAIPAARLAQQELLRSSEAGQQALTRQLQRDVQVGYLQWLKAQRARQVLVATLEVLNENLRVNDSLLRNGRITEDQVLRARTELLNVTQQLREADNAIAQARSYVNFLRNQPLASHLEDARVNADDLQPAAERTAERPELVALDAMAAAAEAQQRAVRSALLPTLALGIDAGTQGESWQFGRGYNYLAASLVFNWKLFDGGASRADAARARLGARQARLQKEGLAQQLALEQQQAEDRLAASQDSLTTALQRSAAANAALRIAQRKRDAGTINQVEFLDARSAHTAAELGLNLTRFELLQRRVELAYAAGTSPVADATQSAGDSLNAKP